MNYWSEENENNLEELHQLRGEHYKIGQVLNLFHNQEIVDITFNGRSPITLGQVSESYSIQDADLMQAFREVLEKREKEIEDEIAKFKITKETEIVQGED